MKKKGFSGFYIFRYSCSNCESIFTAMPCINDKECPICKAKEDKLIKGKRTDRFEETIFGPNYKSEMIYRKYLRSK